MVPALGMKMESAGWANLIAVLAFIVSVIAAVFAWKSATEARTSNRIGTHQYQRDLYSSLVSVRNIIVDKGLLTTERDLSPYSERFLSARLYINAGLSKRLLSFFEMCKGIEQLHINLESSRDYVRVLGQMALGDPIEVSERDISAANARVDEARSALLRRIEIVNALGDKLDSDVVEEIKLI
ncbi:hypothetical protein [Pseudomonas sp. TE3911]